MVSTQVGQFLVFAIGTAVAAAAVATDLSSRRIPNFLSLVLVATGLIAHCSSAGLMGMGNSVAGALFGFCIFLAPYMLGGMGGGDLKLMTGFGAMVGMPGAISVTILAAVAGAIVALAAMAIATLRRRRIPSTIPYAPAIAIGAVLVLVSQLRS